MTHRDDLLRPDPARGPFAIRRASHIEPATGLSADAMSWLGRSSLFSRTDLPDADVLREIETLWPGRWWADLTPVAGPVLGPFDSRAQALQAESDWLQEHLPCLNLSTTSSSC